MTTTQFVDPPSSEEEMLDWFRTMRAIDPVQRDPRRGGWHVLGYAECLEALKEADVFSSNVSAPVPEDSPMALFRTGNLSWIDPPEHTALRALVRKVFTARYMETQRPMISEVIEARIEALRERDHVLIIDDFASHIAAQSIHRLLGLPGEDGHLFALWTQELFALTNPDATSNGVAKVAALTAQLNEYLSALLVSRRRRPQDDLVSRLLQVEIDGRKLTDAEVRGLIGLLLLTGQTTTQTVANSVICLTENPEILDEVRTDLDLLPRTVDEVLRFRSQTPRVARVATREVELGGHTIKPREAVSVWLAAADRDPAVFSSPDVFDIHRTTNPHLALGYGIHFCLGAPMARIETETALRRLLETFSSIEIDPSTTQRLDARLVFGAHEVGVVVKP